MSSLSNAGIFIIGLVFDLYIVILMLRLLMQKVGASYHNPISQLVIKSTNIFVTPLQRVIPGIKGIDLAILVLILVFEFIQAFLLFWMRVGGMPNVAGILVNSIGAVGNKFMNLYFYAIIIRVVMSWITSLRQGPLAEIVFTLTEPIMSPLRRIIPPLGGFDLSPIALLIVLQLISMLVFDPISRVGIRLTLG